MFFKICLCWHVNRRYGMFIRLKIVEIWSGARSIHPIPRIERALDRTLLPLGDSECATWCHSMPLSATWCGDRACSFVSKYLKYALEPVLSTQSLGSNGLWTRLCCHLVAVSVPLGATQCHLVPLGDSQCATWCHSEPLSAKW